ncbi:MAG: primosomal protein N' [Chromatiales bacterium]|jgi:primosomal protein N' (replication factor Y)
MSVPSVLRVAISIPLRALFDYLPPADVDIATLQLGVRLLVPFGRGQRVAVLVDLLQQASVSPDLLKPVARLLDEQPLLRQQDIDFLSWAAAYYQHPAGEVILAALPTHLRKGNALVNKAEKGWRVTAQGQSTAVDSLKRSPKQLQLLQFLQQQTCVSQTEVMLQFGNCRSSLKALQDKALLESCEMEAGAASEAPTEPAPQLNAEQQQAVDSVQQLNGFGVALLNGITGSGKTEVYLALVSAIVASGRQVLVLAPEIGLTPQLLTRFRRRLGANLVALHSGLAETERAHAWQQAAAGQAKVVIGTRSAVFTPMPQLALVIVDEEHDISFKQQEGFRYSARDMAVALAKSRDCPVLLGSATPSFESLQNVERGNYQQLRLTQRAGAAQLPVMDLVDIRSVRLQAGLSPVSKRLIGEQLQQDNQVLVFINRRGFAPVLTCHACGWVDQCKRCDARMTYHAARKLLWCHHCGYQHPVPPTCPECDSDSLYTLGQGTEQVEAMLAEAFPDYACVRIDQDSTRRKGSLESMLDDIHSKKYRILIGTQMLAKGHDFPDVTLVVLLDVDQGLYGSDFRAPERMAQQILQVAGRAGRSDKPGRVLIQTRHPDHPLLQTLIHDGYSAFAHQALLERQQVGFPPFSFQALVRAEATQAQLPEQFLREVCEPAGLAESGISSEAIEFWGPVPAIMQKRAGKHRFHLLLQSASRVQLHHFLHAWLVFAESRPLSKKVRWSVDVDPQDFYS